MGKHTKEPWYAYSLLSKGIHAGYQYGIANSKPCGIQQDEDGNWYPDFPDWSSSSRVIAKTTDGEDAKHNAVLIVACVNALAGIENPEAFVKAACAAVSEYRKSDKVVLRYSGWVALESLSDLTPKEPPHAE